MKKRGYLIGVLLLLITLTISGCAKKTAQYKPEIPEKLIIYHSGQTTMLEQDNQLFKKIVQLSDSRFSTPIFMHSPALKNTFAADLRKNELVIEYIYTKNHHITYKMPSAEVDTSYSRVLFPLTGLHTNQMFLGYSEGYCKNPFGPLKGPEDLSTLLEKNNIR